MKIADNAGDRNLWVVRTFLYGRPGLRIFGKLGGSLPQTPFYTLFSVSLPTAFAGRVVRSVVSVPAVRFFPLIIQAWAYKQFNQVSFDGFDGIDYLRKSTVKVIVQCQGQWRQVYATRAVVKLLSKRWWIRVGERLEGPKLEPVGPKAEVGFPTADQM